MTFFFFVHRPTITKNNFRANSHVMLGASPQRATRCKPILLHERTNCILHHGNTTSSDPRAAHEWTEHSGGH